MKKLSNLFKSNHPKRSKRVYSHNHSRLVRQYSDRARQTQQVYIGGSSGWLGNLKVGASEVGDLTTVMSTSYHVGARESIRIY